MTSPPAFARSLWQVAQYCLSTAAEAVDAEAAEAPAGAFGGACAPTVAELSAVANNRPAAMQASAADLASEKTRRLIWRAYITADNTMGTKGLTPTTIGECSAYAHTNLASCLCVDCGLGHRGRPRYRAITRWIPVQVCGGLGET